MYEPLLPWIFLLLLIVYATMIALRPSMLLRPSVFFSLGMMVSINIAAAFLDQPLFHELVSMDLLRFTTVLFPLPILLWVMATPALSDCTGRIYSSCRVAGRRSGGLDRRERSIARYLAVATLIIAGVYLVTVPFSSTGLWALLFNPANSYEAREMSVKGLENTPVVYLYSLLRSMIAPPLFVLLLLGMWRGRPGGSLLMLAMAFVILFIAGFEGARMPVGWILIAFAMGYMLSRGIFRGAVVFGAILCVVLAIVLGLTLLRESGHRTVAEAGGYSTYLEGTVDRVFMVPFETGVRGVLYAQETGDTGIHTIRPLAGAMNERFINLPREVHRRTFPGMLETGNVNTSFLFDLQVSFGLWGGWFLALVLLFLVDFLVLLFRREAGLVLVAFYAAFLVSAVRLTFSAYTTVLLSGGLLLIPLLMLLMNRLARLEQETGHSLVHSRTVGGVGMSKSNSG